MATCPKRGVLNAGDRPAQLKAAVAALVEAAKPFVPRIMPIAQRRTVPMSTPMPTGRAVPMGQIGLGNLPPGQRITGGMPGLGNPGTTFAPQSGMGGLGSNGGGAYHPATSPITHGNLGPGGTSTGFGPLNGPLTAGGGPVTTAMMVPFITAITAWAQSVTDSINAITETISGGDGMAILWAVDKLIAPYTEPLRIWAPEWVPQAVIAGRIQDTRALNTPLMTGCAVEWVAQPNNEFIEVRSIDGMAANDGKTYVYTFLYFGVG